MLRRIFEEHCSDANGLLSVSNFANMIADRAVGTGLAGNLGGAPGVALCRGLCDWVRAAPRDATTFVSPFLGSSENLGWFDRWATILDEEICNGRSGVWGVNAVGRRVSTAQRVAIGGALVFSTAAAAYCVWRWWRAKAAERRRRARDAGDK
jgi:hypothetical protein